MKYKLSTCFIQNHILRKAKHEKRLRSVGRYAFGEILDIGCSQLPNKFLEGDVTGFDIVPPGDKLPNPPYTKFIQGDCQNLSAHINSKYDSIVACEVIEHLPNYCRFLDECTKALKTNGLLVITTSNPYLWYTFIANVIFPKGMTRNLVGDPYGHVNFQIPRMLNELANCRGLNLIDLKGDGGCYIPFLTYQIIFA